MKIKGEANYLTKENTIYGFTNTYCAELENVMNYIAHSTNLDGVRTEEIKKHLL